VLADPGLRRHTERILALREEERQTRGKLGRIIAEIGAELVAVKEALDRLSDKTAWLRWLKEHVHYSADTAQRYMRVARFSQKNRNVAVFFDLDPSVLYRISALSDELAATLTPELGTQASRLTILLLQWSKPTEPTGLRGTGWTGSDTP
jgi:hypothetical protein